MNYHQHHRTFFSQNEHYSPHDGKAISSSLTNHLSQCKIFFHFLFTSRLTNTNLINYMPQSLHEFQPSIH